MSEQIVISLPKPHPGQLEIIRSPCKKKVILAGRRWGKSLCAIIMLLERMFKGEQVAYVTPDYGLGRKFYREIRKYIPDEAIGVENKSDLYIEFKNGGTLKFLSGESLEKFRGWKFSFIVVDEAAFIYDLADAWDTAIEPTITDSDGDVIFISTPRGKEFFYSLYSKGVNKEDGYESWHFPTNTNPHFPKHKFEELKRTKPAAKFNEEYLAIPGENSANPFGTDHIRANTITTLSSKPPLVFGIDLAKYTDYSILLGLDEDGHTCYFDRFQLPWELTQRKIEQLPANVLKAIDITGVGDVVFERLQMTCQNITGFKFTAESKPKLIYELIKDVEQGALKFNEITANEMFTYQYVTTKNGHLTFNASPGFHDDAIVALALANRYRSQAKADQNWQLYTGENSGYYEDEYFDY